MYSYLVTAVYVYVNSSLFQRGRSKQKKTNTTMKIDHYYLPKNITFIALMNVSFFLPLISSISLT